MSAIDWGRVVDAAHEANSQAQKFGNSGKKYSTVATRIELARRIIGDLSIVTEIVDLHPNVLVKATISLGGVVLATGHAEEVRGQGPVNRTSAVENAETSAVGRALAMMGIHGGEIASLNELEAVGRKEAALNPRTAPETSGAYEDRARDELPEGAKDIQVAVKMGDLMKTKMASYRTIKGLEEFAKGNEGAFNFIKANANATYEQLKAYYRECREAIEAQEKSA